MFNQLTNECELLKHLTEVDSEVETELASSILFDSLIQPVNITTSGEQEYVRSNNTVFYENLN